MGKLTHRSAMTTPLGTLCIESDGECIVRSAFQETTGPIGATMDLHHEAERQLREYFAGERKAFDLPLRMAGTPFQRCVWEAVRAIPFGRTTSYQSIAGHLGGNTAARAIGHANGANPLLILVPCHRVIASDGALTGYAGGLFRKQWLLRHEGAIPSALFE